MPAPCAWPSSRRAIRGTARVRPGAVVVTTTVVVVGLSLVAVAALLPDAEDEVPGDSPRSCATVPRHDDVVVGPIDQRWRRPLTQYLGWRGRPPPAPLHRRGGPSRDSRRVPLRVVWVTGSDPGVPGLTTRPLNDVTKMQVIAGDRTAPPAILPWFVSTSRPRTQATLDAQLAAVARIPALLSPPASSFPRWLFDGR